MGVREVQAVDQTGIFRIEVIIWISSLPYAGINRIRFQGSGSRPSQLFTAPPAKI